MMQSVENRYTEGLTKIFFEKKNREIFMVWQEKSEFHKVPLSLKKNMVFRDSFGEGDYLLASRFRVGTDEDHRMVLIGQVDFCETPFKRLFRLYLDSDHAELVLTEKPGKSFLVSLASSMGPDLATVPIIGKTLTKVEPAVLYGILDPVFEPTLKMRISDD